MKRCPLKYTIYVLNVLGIYNLVFTRIELCAQWLRMTDYDRNLFKTATPKKVVSVTQKRSSWEMPLSFD